MRIQRWASIAAICLLTIGCGTTPEDSGDTLLSDANQTDAGTPDAATPDTSTADAGKADTAQADTTAADSVAPDMASDDAIPADAFELNGEWETNWSEVFTISNDAWGSSAVVYFDNAANVAITQYAADDEFNANAFARRIWTDIDGNGYFYECTVIYSAATFEEAMDNEGVSNTDDPFQGGCGESDFAWTIFGPVGGFEE